MLEVGINEEDLDPQTIESLRKDSADIDIQVRRLKNSRVHIRGSQEIDDETGRRRLAAIERSISRHLERRVEILEKIRVLEEERHLEELKKVASSPGVTEAALRTAVSEYISNKENESVVEKAIEDTEVEQVEASRSLSEIENFERRAQVWHRFLERESVATIIGAIALFFLVISLIVAMFTRTIVPDVLSNSFLLILGYFFGQSIARKAA